MRMIFMGIENLKKKNTIEFQDQPIKTHILKRNTLPIHFG